MSHSSNPHRSGEQYWDEAYPLLPAQYAELSRSRVSTQPERRLMLAVLSDAIVLVRTRPRGGTGPRRHEFEEAKRWIVSDDSAWPYSFVNVCEALGIAFQPLRRMLLAERRRSVASSPQPAARRRLLAGLALEALARTG